MTGEGGATSPLVYLAGSRWDDVAGTDRRLVTALARHRPVLWVDPPQSALRPHRTRGDGDEVAPGVTRVTVTAPPGLSRAGVRAVTRRLLLRRIERATDGWPGGVDVVVSAAPHGVLERVPARRRIFFATDDFIEGAAIMGLSSRAQRRAVTADVEAADVVVAVSPGLAAGFEASGRPVVVIPNGCDSGAVGAGPRSPVDLPFDGPVVGLVGQLNERLDVDVLHRLRAAGVPLLVVGPLTARDRQQRQRLLSYLYSDHVHWVGPCEPDRLGDYLAAMAVGVTPYLPTRFNSGSFPLKTLDYLAAGVPVVTTPLPATGWLDSPLAVQADAESFVGAVRSFLDGGDTATADRCRALAARHDWVHRAAQFAELCDPGTVRTLA